MDRKQTAEYIAALCNDLAKIARESDLLHTAYTLDIAGASARSEIEDRSSVRKESASSAA